LIPEEVNRVERTRKVRKKRRPEVDKEIVDQELQHYLEEETKYRTEALKCLRTYDYGRLSTQTLTNILSLIPFNGVSMERDK
jgi:hypothetical protein